MFLDILYLLEMKCLIHHVEKSGVDLKSLEFLIEKHSTYPYLSIDQLLTTTEKVFFRCSLATSRLGVLRFNKKNNRL